MANVVDEFPAIFVGGIGSNGQIKESWVRVRIYSNKESEFKYMGKLFARWQKLIYNLGDEKQYPFSLRDVYLGGDKCSIFRVYYHSMQLEPYIASKEQSSLKIENQQLRKRIIELQEMLADAKKSLHDINFEDRRKKAEIENSKHQKALRSNLYYNEQVSSGIY